jgi:hypothetical protein
MGLLQLLSLWRSTERLTEIAQRVAERSQREVAQRVAGRTAGMSAAERRGYIRARSAAVIQRESDVALAENRQLRAADRAALVELATNAVIAAVPSATVTSRQRKAA